MPEPILSLRGVSKAFDRNRVLNEVDLDVGAGEVLALLGENGAGKSTLVNIVSGSLRRDNGTIAWEGRPVVFHDAAEGIRAGIIHIHQELSIISSLSVMENLFIGDYAAGSFGLIDRKALRTRAQALLAEVGAGHLDPRTEAGLLSTAEQQMVEIAKALARDARLLVLDEPTAALTPHEAEALFRVVRMLRTRGVGVIFISHRLEEVFAIADRIVVLRDGGVVSDLPVAETSREQVIADMTGRIFQGFVRPADPARGAPRLTVEDIVDGRHVGPVSFELGEGEILGIFGLVGSGRTELLELIAGIRHPAAGTIRRDGRPAIPADPGAAWASGIAILPEGRKRNGILPDLSVEENLVVAHRQAGPALLGRPEERQLAADYRGRLGIVAADLRQPISSLSGGNQQKVLLARCLATRPSILLLDEPTHGVDVRTKSDIYRTIQALAEDGTSVVFVSSELPEVLALASTVLVLSKGRQALYAPNRDLAEETVLAAAFAHS
ncbi:sugar ABC transporter ATP-binding protein [Geminicoccus roseus]|uniref:sugar ABC transporter ATP-binding protein n=1 Tax=Geminicoccus roseus TaxID=404900 RepID=UPI0003FE0442|nr:sugar ABC transporter ATP-binding protein [Geminicoccus roseus]